MPNDNRITGYRKLKKRIKELEHDIKMIVLYVETEEGQETYFRYLDKLNNDKSR